MYKITTQEINEIFNDIAKLTNNTLLEISMKKSRINFEFKESGLIHINDIIDLLEDDLIKEDYFYLTTLDNKIHLTYECANDITNNNIPNTSLFKKLFELLDEIGEHICQCPALEYIISQDYVKVFIDKPTIDSENIMDLAKVFGQSFTLELQKQRPYCLFINTVDRQQTTFAYDNKPQILTSNMVRKL